MPLNDTQKALIQKHLAAKGALHYCFVCEAESKWAFKELVFMHQIENGVVQKDEGITSVLIECGNCGCQLLMSAERAGLISSEYTSASPARRQ